MHSSGKGWNDLFFILFVLHIDRLNLMALKICLCKDDVNNRHCCKVTIKHYVFAVGMIFLVGKDVN